jgi:hypothetical protein
VSFRVEFAGYSYQSRFDLSGVRAGDCTAMNVRAAMIRK